MTRSPSASPEMGLSEIALFFRQETETDVAHHLSNLLGVRSVVRSEDLADGALPVTQVSADEAIFLPRLGIAIFQGESERLRQLESVTAADNAVEAAFVSDSSWLLESFEEQLPPDGSPSDPETGSYWRGYRDAVNNLGRVSGLTESPAVQAPSEYRDDELGTWGLHATGVLKSRYTGQGVRVAALVDGLDVTHPDWSGRQVVMKSFVPGEPPTAAGSSGTHYLGTALGTAHPSVGPRYGCAPNALPYVAKVLHSNGGGSRTWLFAGLDWAIANHCRIILIPLGWSNPLDDPIMEKIASRIAALGGVLIAGAGNSAHRSQGNLGQVINPAACLSVMGVGSLDARLNLPDWTPRSSEGRKIDLVAPGVKLRSSLPRPQLYGMFSGSATAAAYGAGIAALWAEALPDANSYHLWQALVANAQALPLSNQDVGSGFVQAP
jgi:subtilisin